MVNNEENWLPLQIKDWFNKKKKIPIKCSVPGTSKISSPQSLKSAIAADLKVFDNFQIVFLMRNSGHTYVQVMASIPTLHGEGPSTNNHLGLL